MQTTNINLFEIDFIVKSKNWSCNLIQCAETVAESLFGDPGDNGIVLKNTVDDKLLAGAGGEVCVKLILEGPTDLNDRRRFVLSLLESPVCGIQHMEAAAYIKQDDNTRTQMEGWTFAKVDPTLTDITIKEMPEGYARWLEHSTADRSAEQKQFLADMLWDYLMTRTALQPTTSNAIVITEDLVWA